MNELLITTLILFWVYGIGYISGQIRQKWLRPRYAVLKRRYYDKKYECGEIKEELKEQQKIIEEYKKMIQNLETKNHLLDTYTEIFVNKKKIREAIEVEKKLQEGKPWWV